MRAGSLGVLHLREELSCVHSFHSNHADCGLGMNFGDDGAAEWMMAIDKILVQNSCYSYVE